MHASVSRLPRALLCLGLCLLMALIPCAAAFATEGEPQVTMPPQPTPNPEGETYDPDHPELLNAEMLTASAAILIEAGSGNVVFEKNPDQPMYPASTTKIMTALLALQFGDLTATTTVSPTAAVWGEGDSTIPVSAGETVNIRDLIYGMMMRSGNDGAVALAEYVSGSEAAFVQQMNETAAFLGCTNTHFNNATGMTDPQHYSTARDLAIIARAARDVPQFRDLAATFEYTMPATNAHPARRLVTTNQYIRRDSDNQYYSKDGIGIKTGFTNDAMHCFVGAARRNGVEFISVVLYTSDTGRWFDTRHLMDYGFTKYESVDPITLYQANPRILNVSGFDMSDSTNLGRLELGIRMKPEYADREAFVVGTKDEIAALKQDFGKLSHISWTREARAPVTEGEAMGTLTFYPNDQQPIEYELYATRSIEARKDAPPTLAEIEAYTLADPNPLPPFQPEFVIFPAIILVALYFLLRWVHRRTVARRARKQRIPTPKNRYYR